MKAADDGQVKAVVGKTGVVDAHMDALGKGVPAGQTVYIGQWQHALSRQGRPPIGVGKLSEDGDTVLFEGRLFDTPAGQEARVIFKEAPPEWSLGLYVEEHSFSEKGIRNILKASAFEVSPVTRGAMPGTKTLVVKEHNQDLEQTIAAYFAQYPRQPRG